MADEVKDFADDVASHVAYHIEQMYPAAVRACPKSFLLSVRGCTKNAIVAGCEPLQARVEALEMALGRLYTKWLTASDVTELRAEMQAARKLLEGK